ncbi:unnamed protein product [Brassicogethes aeneus]|uniref:Major facilitator superfamily (MFS) profile domain-containing protein n=1 Tax=Brassicogethes aeneus TaxID=1431903 RepID=A0A9P0FHG3_BRAAE|nr:unnamed protein product [Brassicogethes aeneus]
MKQFNCFFNCSCNSHRIYQYYAAFAANLYLVCNAMNYGWPSPSLPILLSGNHTFRITSYEGSWIAVMPSIGKVFGIIFAGLIVDYIGRKKLLLYTSIPFFVSWLMVGFTRTSSLMFIGRFIAGLSDGSFSVIPMYLAEISEPKIRGLLTSFCSVNVAVGHLLINVIGSNLPISTTAFVSSTFPLAFFLLFMWLPESPYFYLMKGNEKAAKRSLQKFRESSEVDAYFDLISKGVKEQNENRGKFLDLFTDQFNRKALIIVVGLKTIQQLSGNIAIMFYCQIIFVESKDFVSPGLASSLYFLIKVIVTSVSSFIVDSTGRRPLLFMSTTGSALSLFSISAFMYVKNSTNLDTTDFEFVPVASLIVFAVFFSLGLQTIPVVMAGEMFPTNIKAFALALDDIYFCVISTLVSTFFYWSDETFGMSIPFLAFGIFCVLGLMFIYFFVPETKKKSLEDIQRMLKGEKL